MRVICCCKKDRVNVENLVPIPRNIRGRTSSMIKVPAPTLVIIAVIVNYRRGYNRKKKGKGGSSD